MADIPTTIDEQQALAEQVYQQTLDMLAGLGVPRFVAQIIAGVTATLVITGGLLRIASINLIKQVAVPVAIAIIQLISEVRKEGAPEFAQVAAEAMGEFMGMDVSTANLTPGQGAAANLERARTLGDAFLGMLESEFAPSGAVTPDSGAKAARAFAGYAINFGAQNAFVSLLSELLSLEHLQQVRELGVEIAENLGLGRLLRVALMPLVHTTIAIPYTQQLNAKYRQTRMNITDMVRAVAGGFLEDSVFTTDMQQLGYRDTDIQALIALHGNRLGFQQLPLLVRSGLISEAGAILELRSAGHSEADAELLLKYFDLQRVEQLQQQLVSDAFAIALHRDMDETEFQSLLDSIQMSDGEKQVWAQRLSLALSHPQKSLSFAQLVTLEEHNLLTVDDLHTWALKEGYSEDDAISLELLLDIKEQDFEAKQKAAAARAAAAAAKAAAKAAGGK